MDCKQSRKVPYSSATRTNYQQVKKETSIKRQKSRHTIGANKRVVKRKLLIQLAIFGLLVWLLVISISGAFNATSHASSNAANNGEGLSFAQQSTQLSSTPASGEKDVHFMVNNKGGQTQLVNSEYNHVKSNDLSLQKQRLQALRMHNVLRNTSKQAVVDVLSSNQQNLYYSGRLGVTRNKIDMQKSLVKHWESEFAEKMFHP